LPNLDEKLIGAPYASKFCFSLWGLKRQSCLRSILWHLTLFYLKWSKAGDSLLLQATLVSPILFCFLSYILFSISHSVIHVVTILHSRWFCGKITHQQVATDTVLSYWVALIDRLPLMSLLGTLLTRKWHEDESRTPCMLRAHHIPCIHSQRMRKFIAVIFIT